MESNTSKRVLVVGLTCLDNVAYCDGFPIEDTDTRCEQKVCLGGNACNNAAILRQLGGVGYCQLVSATADDHTRPLVDRLLTEQMGTDDWRRTVLLRENQATLSTSLVLVNIREGSRTILSNKGSCAEVSFDEFAQLVPDPSQYSWIHFEGRNFVEMRKMIDYVRAKCPSVASADSGAKTSQTQNIHVPKVSVELEKRRDADQLGTLFAGVDVVFVSKDLALLFGYTDMYRAVDGLVARPSCSEHRTTVVCAWGDQGAAAASDLDSVLSCPAFAPPNGVVDTLGAGDTFLAGTIHRLNQGDSTLAAITFGCRLAGQKCGQRGLTNIPLPAL